MPGAAALGTGIVELLFVVEVVVDVVLFDDPD
jgi:hypothetical protein